MKRYTTDILTNASRSTLCTGFTSLLTRRAFEHKHKAHVGFTARYNVNRLVYFERFSDPHDGIAREKQLKGWTRAKKVALIESMNPKWEDLSREWENIYKPAAETQTQMLRLGTPR